MILRKKTTFIEAICHKFEKHGVDFFQDYPNVIRFNLVHLCPSTLLFFFFAVFHLCCSTVLSGYCNVSFHILGILGKKIKYFQSF